MSQREREFEVVFVCTGNRFRSPLAESLLRAATEGLPVRVRSLGMLRVRAASQPASSSDAADNRFDLVASGTRHEVFRDLEKPDVRAAVEAAANACGASP